MSGAWSSASIGSAILQATVSLMRLLGLDVGTRRIGVAISDPLGFSAQGLTVIERRGVEKDIETIERLAHEHKAEALIVGLPLDTDGKRGSQVQLVEAFIESVVRRVALPVHWVDERFTTAQSERVLLEGDVSRKRRKEIIDQLAAQLILQQYLEQNREKENGP